MLHSPTDEQLDALREVTNVGCGHAADALSRLTGGRRVLLTVPRALVLAPREVGTLFADEPGPMVGAILPMVGELEGTLLMLLSEQSARRLTRVLVGKDAGTNEADSALAETANILASACLTAVGEMTGLRPLPSVPRLVRMEIEELVASLGRDGGSIVALDARFQAGGEPSLEGRLMLLPDARSVTVLLEALGVG